jgi:serine/threonine protein kinase
MLWSIYIDDAQICIWDIDTHKNARTIPAFLVNSINQEISTAAMDTEIPGYKIIRPIAEGGMASVYLAMQESLGRNVAIKLLKKFDTPEQAQRFQNEGRIIASLNHRNIITIHDIGVYGDRHFISMEYLEGGDLEERIQAGMSPEEALDLLDVMASCLGFLHHNGIIHRDMKPANILFHKDGTPILTDFGVARQLEGDMRLTMEGNAVGSPYYLSPEQAECKSLDGRTDIYGLGIIFFEMLTGVKPYQGESHIETILAHFTEPLPSLPPTLERYQELLERMIAKDPDERFDTAEDVIEYTRKLKNYNAGDNASAGNLFSLSRLSSVSSLSHVHHILNDLTNTIRARFENTITLLPRGNRQVMAAMSAIAVLTIISIVLNKLPSLQPEQQVNKESPISTTATRVITAPSQSSAHKIHSEPSSTEPPLYGQSLEDNGAKDRNEKSVYQYTAPVDDNSDSLTDQLLHMAQQALDEYRLTTPADDNAYYYYKSILEQDPDNKEAAAGVMRIATIYADLAEKEINRFRYKKAKMYVYRGLSIEPENPRLQELENKNFFSDASERAFGKVKSLLQ